MRRDGTDRRRQPMTEAEVSEARRLRTERVGWREIGRRLRRGVETLKAELNEEAGDG